MKYKKILTDCGFVDSELSGGTLSVTTPIDGSEIASLNMHSKADAELMIQNGRRIGSFAWRRASY